MTVKLIPADAQIAAKRGFIRTTAQAYSTALAGGISASVILGVVAGEVQLVPTLIVAGVTLVSPLLAGGASYFSILSRGIPAAYTPEIVDGQPLVSTDGPFDHLGAHNE
ncbi:hypothetical protein M3D75_02760 [Microbacterium enclense]|uniref:hypothetical protein n=1 Tax=Microbacterium enclense TaxID=993073 RepID=UPI0021A87F0A|nr:hypothetical protein [Microbacterium enclense]MCT2085028.1 hypothetical protein [Microbacterium enclense]